MKSTRTPGHAFVRNVHTETSNGSSRVDLIELSCGKVLAINGEVVVLYPSLKAYQEYVDADALPTISLYGGDE